MAGCYHYTTVVLRVETVLLCSVTPTRFPLYLFLLFVVLLSVISVQVCTAVTVGFVLMVSGNAVGTQVAVGIGDCGHFQHSISSME